MGAVTTPRPFIKLYLKYGLNRHDAKSAKKKWRSILASSGDWRLFSYSLHFQLGPFLQRLMHAVFRCLHSSAQFGQRVQPDMRRHPLDLLVQCTQPANTIELSLCGVDQTLIGCPELTVKPFCECHILCVIGARMVEANGTVIRFF